MDGVALQQSSMEAHKGASRNARVVVLTMEVQLIMKEALWVTGRHGGIDPLDAKDPLIGFSQDSFRAKVRRLWTHGTFLQPCRPRVGSGCFSLRPRASIRDVRERQ